jgi:hypothetical protein
VLRFLSYDEDSALILVLDGPDGVLVDVSLCLSNYSHRWIREPLCMIMLMGYVEQSKVRKRERSKNIPGKKKKEVLMRIRDIFFVEPSTHPHVAPV